MTKPQQQIAKPPVILDQTQEYKSLSTNLKAAFKASTPELTEILSDYPHLQKVAELFNSLLDVMCHEQIKMTQAGANLIDHSIRLLMHSSLEMAKTSALADERIDIQAQIDTDDPEELKVRLSEALYQVEEYAEKDKQHQKESATLTQDIDELYRDSYKLKEKYLQNKRVYEDQLSEYQARIQVLEDKYQETTGNLILQKEMSDNLKKQYDKSVSEIEAEAQENKKLRTKMSELKKALQKAKQTLDQSKHQFEEAQINQKRLMIELEAAKGTPVTFRPQDEKDNIYNENISLKRQVEELSKLNREKDYQLEELSTHKKSTDEDYEIQIQQIKDDLEGKVENANDEIDKLNQKNNDLEEEKQIIQDQLNEKNEKLKTAEVDTEKVREEIRDLKKVFDDNYINPDDVPKICQEARDNAKNLEVIQKLRSSLDALGRFTGKLIEDDTADPEIINRESPLFEDNELREGILEKITKFRDFVKQISKDDTDTVLLYDAIFGFNDNIQALIDNTVIKGENNIYTALIVLVSLLNKAQKYVNDHKQQLSSAYKILPFKRETYSPKDIIDYMESLQKPLHRMKKLLQREFGKFDANSEISELLNLFLEDFEQLVQSFRDDVAPLINFKRKIHNMPEAVRIEILNLRDSVDNLRATSDNALRSTSQQYEQTIQNIRTEMEESKSKDKVAARLREIIQKKDESIKKIKDELAEANDSRTETETAFNKSHAQKEEIELNANVIKHQRDRLQALLEQRARSYADRMKEAEIRAERKREEEIGRINKMHAIEKGQISEKLGLKTKKLAELKAQVKDISNSYEKIISHQRGEMQALVDQNARLTKKLSKTKVLLDSANSPARTPPSHGINDPKISNETAPNTPSGRPNLIGDYYPPSGNNSQQGTLSPYSRTPTSQQSQRSTSPSRSAVNTAIQDLIQDLGRLLHPYCGAKSRWTKPRLCATINEVVQKATGIRNSIGGGGDSSESEWQRWAASLIASSKANLAPNEMRTMIKDMISGSSSRLKLMEKLQSLRFQKKLLITRVLPKRNYPIVCSARTLANVVTVSIGLLKAVKRSKSPTPQSPMALSNSSFRAAPLNSSRGTPYK